MDINKLIIKSINKKKLFCCNCGKYGHKYNKCIEPITSLGIIAMKISDIESYNKLFSFFDSNYLFNLLKSNTTNNNILLKVNKYQDKIKFLMIQRKKTLGYIEFLRGRYNENDMADYTNLFEQMTNKEIKDIRTISFEILWNSLWNFDNKYFKSEYEESYKKYCFIKENIDFDIFLDNIKVKFNTPEWGFPKGRRTYLEKNLACACREFEEETSLAKDDYSILYNIPPINEIFYGTNNVLYKHVYYFALCKDEISVNIDVNNKNQQLEIGNIGFFNFYESSKKIRNYHNERKNILNESFIFFSSIIENKYNLNSVSVNPKITYNESKYGNENENENENEIEI
tara:strand:- start:1098 stop:2123 length:1026 start_codon:yes stop_codon:yes gene_type:complete